MKKHSDKKIIYAALFGNSAIAVMKFIVAVSSGSAAMLAEGFHSTADSVNQMMLLIGHNRAVFCCCGYQPGTCYRHTLF